MNSLFILEGNLRMRDTHTKAAMLLGLKKVERGKAGGVVIYCVNRTCLSHLSHQLHHVSCATDFIAIIS